MPLWNTWSTMDDSSSTTEPIRLACDGNKLHGILFEGFIEVKCNSRFCGHGPGVTVLHRFDPRSGVLLETKKYKDPGEDGQP